MRKRRMVFLSLRGFLWAALLLLLGLGGGVLYLEKYLPPEKVRTALEDALSRFLERKLTIASVAWTLAPPGLTGHDVRLYESDGHEMLSSPKVRVWFSPLSFRTRILEARRVTFVSPRMILRRRPDGDTDLARMIRQIHGRLRAGRLMGEGPFPVTFRHFAVRSGHIHLVDERLQADPLSISALFDADGDLEGVPGDRSFPFLLNARLQSGGVSAPLKLDGRLGRGEGVRVTTPGLPLRLFSAQARWLDAWDGRLVFSGRWNVGQGNGVLAGRLEARPARGPGGLRLSGDFDWRLQSTCTATLLLTDAGTDARLDVTLVPSAKDAWVVFTSSSASLDLLVERWRDLSSVQVSTGKAPSPGLSPAAAAGRPSSWRVEAALDLRRALFRGETLETLSLGLLRERDGTVSVRDLKAAAFGGTLMGDAVFHLPAGGAPFSADFPPRYQLSWRLKDLDVGRFLETFRVKKVFAGMGSSSGTLEGVWPPTDLTKAAGEVTFHVRAGTVWGLPGLVTAFSHLNITSLFAREGEAGGLPFQRADGRFRLSGGRLFFDEPARFENKTLQVAFAGQVDAAAQTVDAAIVLHFLTVLGEVLRAVPGLGGALMGGKKSLFPVVVRVTGPLSDPKFDYQAARSLLAPFWTPFRRPSVEKNNAVISEDKKRDH